MIHNPKLPYILQLQVSESNTCIVSGSLKLLKFHVPLKPSCTTSTQNIELLFCGSILNPARSIISNPGTEFFTNNERGQDEELYVYQIATVPLSGGRGTKIATCTVNVDEKSTDDQLEITYNVIV